VAVAEIIPGLNDAAVKPPGPFQVKFVPVPPVAEPYKVRLLGFAHTVVAETDTDIEDGAWFTTAAAVAGKDVQPRLSLTETEYVPE